MSYMDSPNRAKYLSDVIHRMVTLDQRDPSEKPQEAPETLDAPQVSTDKEKRLERVLERLEDLRGSMEEDLDCPGYMLLWLEDIIRQASGDIDESS